MKRTALQHTKMKRLMLKLGVPQYVAVGIMECLWHLTSREAPAGNIGKLSDDDIALQVDWRGEPAVLIQALLASGWVDVDEELRFIVHDWHEHADDATDNALARSGQYYANGQMPRMNRLSAKEKEELLAKFYRTRRARSVRTKAHEKPQNATALPCLSPALPEPLKKTAAKAAPTVFTPPEWLPITPWLAFVEMRKKNRWPLTAAAMEQTALDLDKLRKAGHDPGAVLMQSVQRCWRGVFELKGSGNGNGNRFNTKSDGNIAAARQAIADIADCLVDDAGDGEAGNSGPDRPEAVRQAPIVLPPERC